MLAFDVTIEDGVVRVIANVGGEPVPVDGEVLVCSEDVDLSEGLPADTAVWLRQS